MANDARAQVQASEGPRDRRKATRLSLSISLSDEEQGALDDWQDGFQTEFTPFERILPTRFRLVEVNVLVALQGCCLGSMGSGATTHRGSCNRDCRFSMLL
jgi:hypothetical protein